MNKVKIVIEDGVISSLRSDRPEELDVEVFYLDDDSVTYEQDLMAVAYMMQDPAFQPVRYHEHGQDPEDV